MNFNYNIDTYQEPCTWYESHFYDYKPPSMRYDDLDAYFKVFDKVFGDREELHPGEFKKSEEHFNRLYKREVRKNKILKFFGFI
jgi:hypothetical protein